MKSIALIACALAATATAQTVWQPDNGDGTYRNPVIYADYSDPDAVAVGQDIWLTASSFACAPGVPILHSTDMVNWQIVNYAIKDVPPYDFYTAAPRHGKGVWAPCIRYHKGEFYIYWGDPDFGIYMIKTTDPRGEWSEPVLVKGGRGMIDPSPLWDDDGRVYLVHAWAASRIGYNSTLVVCEMNAEGTQVISDPVLVFDGNDGTNHTTEGPKLYKRDGWYYIMCPAGGVATGWQVAMRSRSVYGPYEPRVVMAQGSTNINGPHQGAWVHTAAGEDWFLHFQDQAAYGRVIHLQPMEWRDGWPVIGRDTDGDGCGEPVATYRKPTVADTQVTEPRNQGIEGASPMETTPRVQGVANASSAPCSEPAEFNSRHLGLQWEWHANYQDWYGQTSDLGFVRVYGHAMSGPKANMWEVPNLLLQKFSAPEFTATTRIRMTARADGQQGGLIVMGWDYARVYIERCGEKFKVKLSTCKDAEQGGREKTQTLATLPYSHRFEAGLYPNYEREIYLRVTVSEGAMCQFAYSLDGEQWTPAGKPWKARQGKWIGAKVGLHCTAPAVADRGWVDAEWFEMSK